MTTPMQHYPIASAPVSKTGFGFDEIMRNPDYTHFMRWYAQFSYLAPPRQPAISTAAPQATETAKPAAVLAPEFDTAA